MPRPRTFDPDAALWRAAELFWEVGYEAASMQQLTTAMGINRHSMYAVFGSKQALFHAALERYGADVGAMMLGPMEAEGADLSGLQAFADRFLTQLGTPMGDRGCLIVLAASEQSPTDAGCQVLTEAYRQRMQRAFCNALTGAAAAGQLRAGIVPADRAVLLTVLAQGLALQARGGTPPEILRVAVDTLLSDLQEPTP